MAGLKDLYGLGIEIRTGMSLGMMIINLGWCIDAMIFLFL